jgi:hypothetical protein
VIKSRRRRRRWAGKTENAYKTSVRKSQKTGQLGSHKYMYEDNMKVDFRHIGFEDMNWVEFLQDRV